MSEKMKLRTLAFSLDVIDKQFCGKPYATDDAAKTSEGSQRKDLVRHLITAGLTTDEAERYIRAITAGLTADEAERYIEKYTAQLNDRLEELENLHQRNDVCRWDGDETVDVSEYAEDEFGEFRRMTTSEAPASRFASDAIKSDPEIVKATIANDGAEEAE